MKNSFYFIEKDLCKGVRQQKDILSSKNSTKSFIKQKKMTEKKLSMKMGRDC